MIIASKGAVVIIDYAILVLAIFGNCLALQGTLQGKFRLIGYRRFLLSLVASDMFICVVRLLVNVNQSTAETNTEASVVHQCASSILRSLLTVGLLTNLLNLCAMSVDHFIGIVYPMRYRYLMNKTIAKKSVLIVWIFSVCFAFSDVFILGSVYYSKFYYESSQQLSISPSLNAAKTLANCSFMTTKKPFLASTAVIRKRPSVIVKQQNQQQSTAKSTKARNRKQVRRLAATNDDEADYNSWMENAEADEFDMIDDIVVEELKFGLQSLQCADVNHDIPRNNSETTIFPSIINVFATDIVSESKLDRYYNSDVCHFINANKIWSESLLVAWTLISFIFLIICYSKSCLTVGAPISLDSTRRNIRKLVVTTWLLLGVFAACWLPLMAFEVSMFTASMIAKRSLLSSTTYFLIHDILNSIFLCSPLLDPIIYVVRVLPVQRALRLCYGGFLPMSCFLKRKRSETIRHFVYRAAHPFPKRSDDSAIYLHPRFHTFLDPVAFVKREARLLQIDDRVRQSVDDALREELKFGRLSSFTEADLDLGDHMMKTLAITRLRSTPV